MEPKLQHDTLELMKMTLNPQRAVIKFIATNLFGAFLTLLICPQFGISLFKYSLIPHWVYHQGPVICGLFCGSLFLLGGVIFSSFALNSLEWKWVIRHRISLIPYVAFSAFFALMAIAKIGRFEPDYSQFSFYLSWPLAGAIAMFAFIQVRANILNLRRN